MFRLDVTIEGIDELAEELMDLIVDFCEENYGTVAGGIVFREEEEDGEGQEG